MTAGRGEAGPLRPWADHLPAGAPDEGWARPPATTLPRQWADRWSADPSAPLWLEAADPAGGWWSAGRFDEATRRVAGRFAAAGLVPGDRVVWSTASSVTALVANVAALRAGLVVVPANTAYGSRELAHIAADVRPGAAVVDDPVRGAAIADAAPGSVLVVGPEVDLPDPRPGAGAPLDVARPEDPALIGFTSGTTGAPKGAVLSHANLAAGVGSLVAAWRWAPDDRLVHALPVFHAHGLCVGAYGTLTAGASAVLLPGFDPAAVGDAAAGSGGTLFFGVPTMYHRLVRVAGSAAWLGRLRLCVSGSAPLAADLHQAVAALTGACVLERYGMTETLMNVSNPWDGERRPGTVGFPLPGVEVDLGADGEVLVQGPNVFAGYWERPAATAEVFTTRPGGDRWFRTGDVGEVDDGYLVLRGRKTELVITGGYNVYPTEVEDVVAGCPGVAEVAVSGTPSDEWGEVVTAWIVSDGPAPTVDALAAFTADRLADYKRPRIVHVVDALPRNAMGKVVRGELR